MCDFHSIVVRKDGAIAHTADNSHSGAIAAFGWRENTDQQTFFVECEWDGIDGEYSLKRVVSLRNGLTLEDLTNKQVRSINRHYKALANVMSGDITAILPGGLLHGVVYWDVYLAARRCAKVSLEDLERIQKELLTVTGGDEATVTGGYWATVTGGDRTTVTGGDRATVTGGYWATVTGGDRATVTGGNRATVTGGFWATVTGGDRATVIGGNRATVTGGVGATVTGGVGATVKGGDRATVKGGDWATVTGGYWATVTGGYWATVTGGDRATVIGGNRATVTGGDRATVTGGVGSVLILTHDNKEAKIWQRKMVIVDNDKIRANVPYYLDDAGNFTEL